MNVVYLSTISSWKNAFTVYLRVGLQYVKHQPHTHRQDANNDARKKSIRRKL